MDVNFGAIINRSFQIAWRYKSLWIFGLFAGGSSGFNFDMPTDFSGNSMNSSYPPDFAEVFGNQADAAIAAGLILLGLVLGILFLICYSIAKPAIIDAVNKITRGGEYRFGTSFSRGVDLMWRIIGLDIIFFMAIMAMIMLGVILAIISLWSLMITIPCFLAAMFFVWHTFALAEVAIVARDVTIGDAIAEGWELMTRNKANCFMISLLYVGIAIGFGIAFWVIALFTFAPIGILVAFLTRNLVLTLVLALIFGLPVSLVIGGFMGTFSNSIYTQFYFKLYEPEPTIPDPATAYPTA